MAWDSKWTGGTRNATYKSSATMQHAIATSACRRGRRYVQMSCSNHAVSAIVAGAADNENAFALLDWVEPVERL
jgi:hypothetical protein